VAKLNNGYELQVASFIEIGERIEIDSRDGSFRARAKN
jgi:elongation factor P